MNFFCSNLRYHGFFLWVVITFLNQYAFGVLVFLRSEQQQSTLQDWGLDPNADGSNEAKAGADVTNYEGTAGDSQVERLT